jgi:hypothetical protein
VIAPDPDQTRSRAKQLPPVQIRAR